MSKPRRVHTLPWVWHHDDGTDELCIAIQGGFSKRIIVAASQLREVADALHDRADEIESTTRVPEEEPTMATTPHSTTESTLDKLMIRAMRESKRADAAEEQVAQQAGRIRYLEAVLRTREAQLEELRQQITEDAK